MTSERISRAYEVFEQALERAAGERSAFVAEACAGDAELRAEVESLLEHDQRASSTFLRPPQAVSVETQPADPDQLDPLVGRSVGRYRVLGLIGSGGMGQVYEAEQESPRRTVALKVIRAGFATARLLRRFEHEAQILGRLEHPGIATIFEAGTFDLGHGPQPFFAMELIRGEPLGEYASRSNLGIRARLELLAKVADAVHHAHQKGVIHRDLKPGNILITAGGEPKVLDFGVARAVDADVQATTMQTDLGQLVGTIAYMSPEQAGGESAEVDTRSDVYALGIVAYELLAGCLPYQIQGQMVHEAVRVIRESTPTPLSAVNRVLRGDVEIIVGKALQKERARRYQSASDFASDIRRYLCNEAIVARPPSAWYQLSRFARRNRGIVGGVVTTMVVLAAGLAGTTVFALRAEQRRVEADRARSAEEEARRAAESALVRAERAEAETAKRADELEKVAQFQASQLSQIDPALMGIRIRESLLERRRTLFERQGLNPLQVQAETEELNDKLVGVNFTDIALRVLREDIFDRALGAIEREFPDKPLLRARLLQTVGETLQKMGLLDSAVAPQNSALELRRRILGESHQDTLVSVCNVGSLLLAQGKVLEAEPYLRVAMDGFLCVLGEGDSHSLISVEKMGALHYAQGRFAEAEEHFQRAYTGLHRIWGDDHPDTVRLIADMGAVRTAQGKFDEAEALMRQVVSIRRRMHGDDDPATAGSLNSLGVILHENGKWIESEACIREALELRRRKLGAEHPDTLASIASMALVLSSQGKFAEAEAYFREALDGHRRVLGDDHPSTARSMDSLGNLLREAGKLSEAEQLQREALRLRQRTLGATHPETLDSLNSLGGLLQQQGKLGDAEQYLRDALAGYKLALDSKHPDTLNAMNSLALLLQALGKLGEAEPHFREALAGYRSALGVDHPSTLNVLNNLGALLREQGRLAEAEPYLHEALAGYRHVLGNDHMNTLVAAEALGGLLYAQGRRQEAEQCLREVLQIRRRTLGNDHMLTLRATSNLGVVLLQQGNVAEAETLLHGAFEGRRRVLGSYHPDTLVASNILGSLLHSQGRNEAAEYYLQIATEHMPRVLGRDHPETLAAFNNLGLVLQIQGRHLEAEPYCVQAMDGFRRMLGSSHPRTLGAIRNGGALLVGFGRFEEAECLLMDSELLARQVWTGDDTEFLGSYLATLGEARIGVGEFADAEETLLEAYQLLSEGFGEMHDKTTNCASVIAKLYDLWRTVEPNNAYDTQSVVWRARAGEVTATDSEVETFSAVSDGNDGAPM